VVAPLVAGSERLGLLAAFLDRPESDSRWVLGAVASHAAVAIKHLRLVDWLKRKNLARDFLEALTKPSTGPDEVATMAIRLGCNLQAPHLVLAATPRPQLPTPRTKGRDHRQADGLDWDELFGRLEARLRADLPGCLLDRRGEILRGLLRVGSAGPGATLEALRNVLREPGLGGPGSLAIGVSDECRGREELVHGFQEADYAARVGPLMKEEAEVSSYPDLGAYRYVLESASGVRDGSLERLERLVDYERRRGTELLRTLKVYLDQRGNIARTARTLYMHPNTLRQRLARIAAVADIDLEREDWISLAMAIRVVELRQMQGATGRVDDDQ
jgi:sugar diacid utilization regulator